MRTAALALAALAAALVVFVLTDIGARAHSFYSPWCCNNKDCREIGFDDVQVTPHGYLVKINGELIPFGDDRIKPTPVEDVGQHYHICILPGATRIRCFYVPEGGS